MSRWLLLLVCFSLCVHVHAATDGQKDFASAGWPAMVMLFGPALLIYTIASGVIQHGFLNVLQHKMFLLFHIILLFCAIMLSFGPGGIPPVNILGLQLWFLNFIGIHLMFHSNVYVKWVYFVVGVFTLLGLTGSLATLGYSAPIFSVTQQVLCYTIFCGMGFFWSCLRVILYFSGASDTSPDSWQYWVFVVTLTIAPFIYIICTTTAYYLYKEMRTIVNDLQSSMMDGIGGGGGAYGYNDMDYERAAVNSGNNNIWGHNESHPSGYSGGGGSSSTANQNNNTGGFRAFTGAGHRLGQ